ncbi:MAG: hypothetical protein ABR980_02270 [Ignavibacteriaceae bacterium]|jgi:hypothetical protein
MLNQDTKQIELIPTQYASVFNVQLKLVMETRFIGKVDIAGEGKFLTQRKLKHILKKTNSLGVNHQLLINESIKFRWIIIDFEGHKYITSRLYFLTHGQIYTFGNAGFEKQIFLPLNEFGINRARGFDNSDLFMGGI